MRLGEEEDRGGKACGGERDKSRRNLGGGEKGKEERACSWRRRVG